MGKAQGREEGSHNEGRRYGGGMEEIRREVRERQNMEELEGLSVGEGYHGVGEVGGEGEIWRERIEEQGQQRKKS